MPLNHCEKDNQETNHSEDGVCLKCKGEGIEPNKEEISRHLIIKEFEELFVVSKPFEDTMYSFKAGVFKDFLITALNRIETETVERCCKMCKAMIKLKNNELPTLLTKDKERT